MLKALFRFLCWLILKMFFHEVGAFNESKVPREGPLILVCAPHANQFLDPIVVTKHLQRKVLFLAAQKSLERKYVGKMIKAMDSIGVKRPQDYMKKATGTVTTAGALVTGVDTKFLSEFATASAIYLSVKKDIFEIASVISDTELKLKAPLSQDVIQPTPIKFVPRIDQNEVYEHVWAELKRGGCIGIFPEGGSHDQTSILPLKAGVTIMALGAMAAQPGLDVKIIPVGLNYFNGDRFRSLAYADFGDPISIAPELVEKYKDKATKREACTTLLENIFEGLQAVTVNAPDYASMRLIQMFRRLYNPGVHLGVDEKLKLNRRFALAWGKFKDDPRVKSLAEKIGEYDLQLRNHHAKDSQVAHLNIGGCRSLALLVYRIFKIIVLGLCALPGFILYAPVGLVASHYSEIKAKEAKAASNVKIYGRDVLATWKVMIGTVLLPLVTLLYAVVPAIVLGVQDWGLSIWPRIFIPIGTFFLLPFVGYASVRFVETIYWTTRSLRPLQLSLCPCCECSNDGVSVWDLKQKRLQLQQQVFEIVDQLGPETLAGGDVAKFEEMRVIRRSLIATRLPAASLALRQTSIKSGTSGSSSSSPTPESQQAEMQVRVHADSSGGADDLQPDIGVASPTDDAFLFVPNVVGGVLNPSVVASPTFRALPAPGIADSRTNLLGDEDEKHAINDIRL